MILSIIDGRELRRIVRSLKTSRRSKRGKIRFISIEEGKQDGVETSSQAAELNFSNVSFFQRFDLSRFFV